VTSIAADFGLERWEDLMPYSVASFFFFGLGSLPAGRLGDLWGRRQMMITFFLTIGMASILVSFTQTPLQLAFALAALGLAASIYHPIGIPMLVQGAAKPGWVIGVNGLVGNLGLAAAAGVTGLMLDYFGWRMAFIIPGLVSIVCGLIFAACSPKEAMAPARKKPTMNMNLGFSIGHLLLIMTLAATSSSVVFNFSTNSNFELLTSRFEDISRDPSRIGFYLAIVYVLASLTQVLVGTLLDKVPLKVLYLSIISIQIFALVLAANSLSWTFYFAQLLFMASIFGAVPFTEAMVVRYIDDSMRSRISGMRLAIALAASSIAVWLIGPIVKASGFTTLLWVMAATSCITLIVISRLPETQPQSH
jgi:MFS family permease